MGLLFSLFGYEKAGKEENNACQKLKTIMTSLEELKTIANSMEMKLSELTQEDISQSEVNDAGKPLQHGQQRFLLQQRMLEDVQSIKDWIKTTQGLNAQTHRPEDETTVKIKTNSSSRKKSDRGAKIEVVSLLYCPQKVDLVTSVMRALNEMIITHLSTQGFDLKMQICESLQDIREGVPLIVICLHSSRLGTDVINALRGIRPGPNVAVMVLHYKDSHALPSTSSEKILTGQEFQRIGAIVDMGFLSQKGFYACDINSRAIMVLSCFITGRKSMQ